VVGQRGGRLRSVEADGAGTSRAKNFTLVEARTKLASGAWAQEKNARSTSRWNQAADHKREKKLSRPQLLSAGRIPSCRAAPPADCAHPRWSAAGAPVGCFPSPPIYCSSHPLPSLPVCIFYGLASPGPWSLQGRSAGYGAWQVLGGCPS